MGVESACPVAGAEGLQLCELQGNALTLQMAFWQNDLTEKQSAGVGHTHCSAA